MKLLATSLTIAAVVGSVCQLSHSAMPPTVAPGARLEVVYQAERFFEGPSYDPSTGTLYFTTLGKDRSQVLKLDRSGHVSVLVNDSGGVNGTFLSRRGGLLGCQGDRGRIVRIELAGPHAGRMQVVADRCQGKPFRKPNDIVEDARGGFYFTDPDFKDKKASVVYYVSPQGQVRPVVTDMQVCNGIYIAKGGLTLYVSDSAAKHIRAYPIDPLTGAVNQRRGRLFFDPQTENRRDPDGMTMDEYGNMYFTGRGGVWAVSPEGKVLGLIAIPEFCSNCTFGGPDGKTLYMTCQGKVYRLAMGVRGWQVASRLGRPGGGPLRFQKIVLDTRFRSEGVAAADVDRDGRPDVLAGEVWYRAPNWTMHEISPPGRYDGATGYSHSFACFSDDWTGDGYPDLMVIAAPGEPAHWYENPRGRPVHWKRHEVWHSACNESPQYADLLGTGRRQLVMGWQPPGKQREGIMAYFTPPSTGSGRWQQHAISGPKAPGTFRYAHSLGVGDVNGDGRNDVLITSGWWEAPADRSQSPWTFHPAPFGPDAADMHVYDVNGDGLNDVISSSAHTYGVWWYEQARGPDRQSQWQQHLIDHTYSQTHALHLVDMDGDGLKDLVTGKRYYAHQGHDPGGQEPVVLCWYQLRRGPGRQVQWQRHLIDIGSGVGTQFDIHDLNGDGRPDIVVSNKKGVCIMLQAGRRGRQ